MVSATKSRQKLTARQYGILAAVCMLYFCAPEFSAITPTLALMPSHYGVSAAQVSWITAMANPSACIAGLLVGTIAGRRISYRHCAIASSAMFLFFGMLPFLWPGIPFELLLAARFLFGLGCGCFTPLCQAIITRLFEDETVRSAWIGVLNIFFSIGASVGSIFTGALAAGGVWQNAYAFYVLGVIPFVLVLLFVRDESIIGEGAIEEVREAVQEGEKRRIPGVAVAFICTFVTMTMLTQTFFNYGSVAMGESGCDTLLIGAVLTSFTVAGIVIATGNAFLWKILRLFNFPLAYALVTVGYVLALAGCGAGNIAFFFAAAIVMGVGCCIAGMVMPMVMSVTCTAGALTLAIGLQEVARNLGSFLSAPWLNLIGAAFGDNAVTQFTAAFILGVVATGIALFLAIRFSKRFKREDGE